MADQVSYVDSEGVIVFRDMTAEEIQERITRQAEHAAREAARDARQADLDELIGAKLAAAVTANANDLAAIDTATAAEVRTIVKRMLTREAKYIKLLSRLVG